METLDRGFQKNKQDVLMGYVRKQEGKEAMESVTRPRGEESRLKTRAVELIINGRLYHCCARTFEGIVPHEYTKSISAEQAEAGTRKKTRHKTVQHAAQSVRTW